MDRPGGMGPGGGGMGGPPLPNQKMAQIAQQANLTPEQRQQLQHLLTLNPEQVRETLEYTVVAFEHVAKTLEPKHLVALSIVTERVGCRS